MPQEFTGAFEDGRSPLATHDVAADRAERIRQRCRQALVSRSRRHVVPSSLAATVPRWLEPAWALALSVVYLVAALGSSLALYR